MTAQSKGSPIEIEFGQYALPPLQDGSFTVTTYQTVSLNGAPVEVFQLVNRFEVLGRRYDLGPGDVSSVFPPNGAQGEFGNVLPHVVFNATTLPWQRSPDAPVIPDDDVDSPQATWLAILLFDENDPPPTPVTIQLGEFQTSGATFVVPRTPAFGESDNDPVTVIDVPIGLFNAIAPSRSDLMLSANVRKVDVLRKAAADDMLAQTDYGVVFGTRLPTPGNTATAHLVSLEDWGDFLPDENGVPSTAFPKATQFVRLTTLKSWSFTAFDLQQTFTGLFRLVCSGPLQTPFTPPPTPTTADDYVERAYNLGYTALNERLRNGEETVSWYRGPLLPLGTQVSATPPYTSADELQLYAPTTGLWDVSYAGAWQLGRLMGLRERAFAAALYRWKLGQAEAGATALEREILEASLPVLPPYEPPAPTVEATAVNVHQRLRQAVLGLVGPALDRLSAGLVEPSAQAPVRPLRPRLDEARLASALAATPPTPEPAVIGTDQEQIINWLTQVHRLKGVPFNYLVPDIGMLPTESIRFFQIDNNWMEALIDGAFSLGFCGVTDTAGRARLTPLRTAAAARARSGSRRQAAERAPGPAPMPTAPEVLSGFLLRSALVAGWPGMEVRAYSDALGAVPLDLVRLEIVGPSMLLCIVAGNCACVDIQESSEALHFGVKSAAAEWSKDLRYADSFGAHTAGAFNGQNIPLAPRSTNALGDHVLSFGQIANAMKDKIWSDPAHSGFLTAAEFALEMVEGAEAVRFVLKPSKTEIPA